MSEARKLGGHIRGTSLRDLSRSDENRRDLSRRSQRIRGTFAVVTGMHAREPGLQTDSLTCRQRQVLVQVPCGGQT
jgi:hypothetical protein